jgi:protein FrlC
VAVSGFIPAQFRYPTNLCIANKRIRQDSIAYIKESIETAIALGAPLVSLCPGHSLHGQSKEDAWERLKDSLRTLSAYASQLGGPSSCRAC